MEAYGAAGNAVEALLALDGHVGAVGSLELDIEGSCIHASVRHLLCSPSICARMLTLGGVVEILVDELYRGLARNPLASKARINGGTHVVGGLAQVTEGRNGHGDGLVDLAGELLGAAVGLGDVGGERSSHREEACKEASVGRLGLRYGLTDRSEGQESGGRGEERRKQPGKLWLRPPGLTDVCVKRQASSTRYRAHAWDWLRRV